MSSSKVSGGGDGEDADVVDEADADDGAAEFFYSPSSSPLGLS